MWSLVGLSPESLSLSLSTYKGETDMGVAPKPRDTMSNFTFYLTKLLLLLLLTSATTGNPVSVKCAQDKNSALFKELLDSVTNVLEKPDAKGAVCYFIYSKDALLSSESETAEVCAPNMEQSSNCTLGRKSSFNETKCRSSIMKDVTHYDAVIRSYLKHKYDAEGSEKMETDVLQQTLSIIQRLVECSGDTGRSDPTKENLKQMSEVDWSFRSKMCALMRGLRMRLITINRAIGYMRAGDYKQ